MTQRPSSPISSSKVPALLGGATLLLGLSAVLAGCPIYDAESCAADPKCSPTYDTGTIDDTGSPDGAVDSGCGAACPAGYTCNNVGPGEFKCQAYDCRATEKACKSPELCTEVSTGNWQCKGTAPDDCTKTGCIAGYSCKDVAGGAKRCESTDPNACVADADCPAKTGAGSLCLGGVCKAPKDLCSDSTQCSTGTCIDGRCAAKCSATCATGYTCDDKTSACTGGGGACSDTKACTSGTCVAGRCVAPAATNGACPAGQVSVAGGCVVDDRPAFFCDKDGTKEGEQDVCAAGSICLHHNCYRACTGSPDCATLKDFPVCKDVTTTAGTPKKVCGSATSFGTECDLSAATPKPCATGKVCLDGKCI